MQPAHTHEVIYSYIFFIKVKSLYQYRLFYEWNRYKFDVRMNFRKMCIVKIVWESSSALNDSLDIFHQYKSSINTFNEQDIEAYICYLK